MHTALKFGKSLHGLCCCRVLLCCLVHAAHSVQYPLVYSHTLTGVHTRACNLVEVVTGTSTSEGLTEASPMVSLNGFSAQQRSTPDRVRQAISNAQRKRYKDNPELRAQVSAKLKVRRGWWMVVWQYDQSRTDTHPSLTIRDVLHGTRDAP